jgi:hypothetical protein
MLATYRVARHMVATHMVATYFDACIPMLLGVPRLGWSLRGVRTGRGLSRGCSRLLVSTHQRPREQVRP